MNENNIHVCPECNKYDKTQLNCKEGMWKCLRCNSVWEGTVEHGIISGVRDAHYATFDKKTGEIEFKGIKNR